MKGDPKVIEALNKALTIELTAINQYFVQAKMCTNWGFHKLAKHLYGESMEEMKHAEKLIARILFLEGIPTVSKLNELHIGADVKRQLANDLAAELNAQKQYNSAIREAVEIGDNGSRELLESILKDEEDHIDWLEAQRDQVEQYGLDNYLANQIFKD